jgi:hypothetical protein
MDLGAKIHGAEMCYLVHFLKYFQKGRICEILFKKGLKNKKTKKSDASAARLGWRARKGRCRAMMPVGV